jgi:hypothetical protein
MVLVAGTAACSTAGGQEPNSRSGDPVAGSPAGLPMCPAIAGSTIPTAGNDYLAQVPARFGWLPPGLVTTVSQGPPNGTTSPPVYETSAYSNFPDRSIELTVYPDADKVPGQHQPSPQCRRPSTLASVPPGPLPSQQSSTAPPPVQTPAPPVNGAPAYWYIQRRDWFDYVKLVWRRPSGLWFSLTAIDMPDDIVQTTLEHVADTLTIGDLPLPLPVQITRIPATAQMRPVQINDTQLLPGGTGFLQVNVGLQFGPGRDAAGVSLWVFPAGRKSAFAVGSSSPCKTANHLIICVTTPGENGSQLAHYIPGGAATLLAHVISLGPDQTRWKPNFITNTQDR